ncbi:MAG TPA: hypothetical protein VH592_25145 [Gemmataceae bacterium]|jgi:hypothetical protein
MTEGEWLECDRPHLLFNYLFQQASSDRKMRLFACACCRRIWHLLTDKRSRHAVEVTELNVDGAATSEELAEALAQAKKAVANAYLCAKQLPLGKEKVSALREAEALQVAVLLAEIEPSKRDDNWIGQVGVMASQCLVSHLPGTDLDRHTERQREIKLRCVFLHDIFGNPFRPIAFSPSCLTTTVVSLAQVIYHKRAFHNMPELADALEEAGCTNADILAYCRQPGEHVRGCWVVDLLLGKE